MKPVEIFHVGPQKTGTTWIYRCLLEHPEVACPPKDSIHYFDMHYTRGREWYASHFSEARDSQKLFDPTPSYFRSPWAPRRIVQENPRAKIALCLRNPIDRAFSHYWHEKKKDRFDFEFEDVLRVYDCYANWLEPGLYAEHIERLREYFPPEQLLCQTYEHLDRDPRGFLDELFGFLEIDVAFSPSVLDRKINVAGPRRGRMSGGIKPRIRSAFRWLKVIPGVGTRARQSGLLTGKSEYVKGISPELHDRLQEVCEPEIARLERLLQIDLDCWRRPRSGSPAGGPAPRESLSPQS